MGVGDGGVDVAREEIGYRKALSQTRGLGAVNAVSRPCQFCCSWHCPPRSTTSILTLLSADQYLVAAE